MEYVASVLSHGSKENSNASEAVTIVADSVFNAAIALFKLGYKKIYAIY